MNISGKMKPNMEQAWEEELGRETMRSMEMSKSASFKEEKQDIERTATSSAEQSKSVLALRIIVYITLVLSIAGIIAGMLSLVGKGKQEAFEEEIERISDDAMLILGSFIHSISSQLSDLSTTLTAQYVSNTNDAGGDAIAPGFPGITLPFFDQRVQVHPEADVVFYTPILSSDVTSKREWEDYASQKQGWIDEDLQNRGWTPINTEIPYFIHQYTGEDLDFNSFQNVAAPIWQFSPPPKDRSIINMDALTYPYTIQIIEESLAKKGTNEPLLSESFDSEMLLQDTEFMNSTTPRTLLSMAVLKTFSTNDSTETPEVVGQMFALMSWEKALGEAFEGVNIDLQLDVQESCGLGFSFILHGGNIAPLPTSASAFALSDTQVVRTLDHLESCQYTFTIRPTGGSEVHSAPAALPTAAAIIACCIALFLMVVFHLHNRLSKAREAKLFASAQSSAAMVSSLFPSAVQSRLMAEVEGKKQDNRRLILERSGSMNFQAAKELVDSKPIADFFPEATIMFADICGFTAWSSMREPSQVFTLLESLYHSFDQIARRRKVFKVETIGDCYVAVVGLPEPCKGHAVVMSRFANDCLIKMKKVVKALEVSLGPDTADLGLRVGLHSGPVTAGVLRGDKARFQLFGDTVNTCSRIETTGKQDKIHISKETANILLTAGKDHWIEQREDKVTAKGKGELTTFWLTITKDKKDASASAAMSASLHTLLSMSSRSAGDEVSEKHNRLVDWITNELAVLLRVVEMTRMTSRSVTKTNELAVASLERASLDTTMKSTPLNEIKEIIDIPPFDPSFRELPGLGDFNLSLDVLIELRDFVNHIAMMYRENPFHNFEHASHVSMSVVKLLTRIVTHSNTEQDIEELHHQTYGIASDPLTQFTMVLSALVHDVDHPGVSNAQLVKEKTSLAQLYNNKSIAEQNSVDKTWILLMEGDYQNLRNAIYKTEAEFIRFRSVLVNTVMATDIMDKELAAARKARWEKAFNPELDEDPVTASNRKATIVLEHLIQASDVAHTMQHWHIYRRWNERLYNEMYKAFENKRGDSNPTDGWYKGEIGFYDFYIIPLAKKLKDCGVFGVSSDEYLIYAQQNRREWELNGKAVVESMKPNLSRTSSNNSLIEIVEKKVPSAVLSQSNCEFKTNSDRESEPLPSSFSILIIDDDKISRKLLSKALKKIAPDWRINEVESGEEALPLASSSDKKFDLIFVDEYLGNKPGALLGSDVVTKLREQGFGRLICGMSGSDAHASFKDAGADSFVFKPLPFRPDALTKELGRIIALSSTA
ncbi:unnamed protein product [Cylindrotheca closterium]|uniref:Phosphodiesterase n=1 Tax=Cylindrotheca closterium TaxID=2856 RepID=A0AAD2CM11_9STRA|nr:unnamed protein product [Cylindrotheca closterium]